MLEVLFIYPKAGVPPSRSSGTRSTMLSRALRLPRRCIRNLRGRLHWRDPPCADGLPTLALG
jgi:hypothetical protein